VRLKQLTYWFIWVPEYNKGDIDSAKRLLLDSHDYHSVFKIMGAAGKWESALQLAGEKDRLSIPTIFYNFAYSLKASGDESGALAALEKSSCSESTITRMLMKDKVELMRYAESSKNRVF
jgi:hypothetical protein